MFREVGGVPKFILTPLAGTTAKPHWPPNSMRRTPAMP